MNRLKDFYKSTLCLTLAGSLVAASGGASSAAPFVMGGFPAPALTHLPQVVRSKAHQAYFTEQAMVQDLISQRFAPGKISLGHLYLTHVKPIHRWSRKPVFKSIPQLQRGYVAAAVVTLLLSALNPWIAIKTGVLMACGNLLAITRVKPGQIAKTLEPGIRDLVNRGVYSFGFSFQIPVKRTIPRSSQMPGFPEEREVIVWEYQVGKVLLWKREGALESAKEQMETQIQQAMKRAAYIPDYFMVSFHSRLGSVGTHEETVQELEEAAQPGIAPPRGHPELFALRFEPVMEDAQGFFGVHPDYPMDVALIGDGLVTTDKRSEQNSAVVQGAKPYMGWRYVKDEHQYQMNGDLSGLTGVHATAPSEDIGNQEARNRLSRWLRYDRPRAGKRRLVDALKAPARAVRYLFSFWKPDGRVSPGDAPIQAMYLKMGHTERMPGPAVRYSLFTYVIRPGEPRDLNPPFELMNRSALFFAQAYRYWVKDRPEVAAQWFITPQTEKEATALVEVKTRHALEFATFMLTLVDSSLPNIKARDDFQHAEETQGLMSEDLLKSIAGDFNPGELKTFLTQASLAFWRNGLDYAALRETKPRVEGKGTQAADYNSVIEPQMRVTTANGQSLVYALGEEDAFVASDRLVVKALPPTLADQKVKVDSAANESATWRIIPAGIRVSMYRGASNTPISKADIEAKRLRPLRDPSEESQNGTNGYHGMESGVRRGAIQIPKINRSWQKVRQGLPSPNPASATERPRNLTPVTERTRIWIQGRLHRALLTTLFSKGLPVKDLDDWAWQQADRLSRELWLKAKTPQAILAQIHRLADEKTQAHPAATQGASPYVDLASLIPTYDALYVGTGKSALALEKSALSLARSLGLNIRVMYGGDLLKIVNKYARKDPVTKELTLDVDGLLRELKISKHTLWRIASDSGAETYEANILSAVAKVTTEEPFGIAGTNDNHLVDQFGPARVETTENSGSKTQDGMPAYLSMIQTLEEGDLWATENITRRFATGGDGWENHPFFQTPFTNEQVNRLLIPSNDRFVDDMPERLLGYTANGVALDTTPDHKNDSANIRKHGLSMAERHLEDPRFWVIAKAYVIVTVALSFLGFGPIGHFLLPYVTQSPSLLATVSVNAMDALIYNALGLTLLLVKRQVFLWLGLSDTKVLEGWGLPTTLFVSPYAWVHEALEDYGWVGEGLAYIKTKSTYLSVSLSKANDKFRAAGNRNTVSPQYRSGADHEAFEFDDTSTDQAGRHFKTQVSVPVPMRLKWLAKLLRIKPVSPKVIHTGTHTPPGPDNNWGLMARTKDETVGKVPLVVPPGTAVEDLPYHVAEYYQEQYVAFSWLLMGIRRQASRADKVAKGVIGLFRYASGVFLGGYAVKSTQAPSPGSKVLAAAERLAAQRPFRMVAIADPMARQQEPLRNPIIDPLPQEWHAWPQAAHWLPARTGEQEFEQPWRLITQQPGQAAPRAAAVKRSQKSRNPIASGPTSTPEGSTPLVEPPDSAFEELAQGIGRRRTSLVTSRDALPEIARLRSAPIRLSSTHPLLPSQPTNWDRSEASFKGLALLFRSFARLHPGFQPKRAAVVVVEGLDRMAEFIGGDTAGLFVWDRRILEDIAHAVPGALLVAQLESADEIENYEQWATRSQKTPAEWELTAQQSKVRRFILMTGPDRTAVMKYLKTHDNPYDPEGQTRALYEKINKQIIRSKVGRSKELKEKLAERLIEEFAADLDEYVSKALARVPAANAEPAAPAVKSPSPSLSRVAESEPPAVSPAAETSSRPTGRILPWKTIAVSVLLTLLSVSSPGHGRIERTPAPAVRSSGNLPGRHITFSAPPTLLQPPPATSLDAGGSSPVQPNLKTTAPKTPPASAAPKRPSQAPAAAPPKNPKPRDPTDDLMKELQAIPRQGRAGATLRTMVSGFLMAAGAVFAGSNLWAAPLNQAAKQAVQSGLQTASPIAYVVKGGDYVDKIASMFGTTRDALVTLNPFLKDRMHIAGDGANRIFDIRIFPTENITVALPSHPLPVSLTQLPEAHHPILNSLPDAGFWQQAGELAWSYAPQIIFIGLAAAFVVYMMRRYAHPGRSFGSQLKYAVAGLLALFQLAAPAGALIRPPGNTALTPYSHTRLLPELDQAGVNPLPESSSIVETVDQVAAQILARETPVEQAEPAETAVAPEVLEVEQPPLPADQPSVEDARQAAREAPLLKAIERYRWVAEAKTLYRKDFWKEKIGKKEKRSRWSWLNPGRAFFGPAAHNLFGDGGIFGGGGTARDAVKAMQDYAIILAEEDWLTARQDLASREAVYKAAVAWETAQRELYELASQNPQAASEEAAQSLRRSETASAEAKLRVEDSRGVHDAFENYMNQPLPEEEAIVKPVWDRLIEVRKIPRVSASSFAGREAKSLAAMLEETQGVRPPVLARNELVQEQQALARPRIVALLGEQKYWSLEETRLGLLFKQAPGLTEADRQVENLLLLEVTTAGRRAGFAAAVLAADAGLDLSDLSPRLPDAATVVFQLSGPAAELPQVPNMPTNAPGGALFGDADELSREVGANVEDHKAAAEAFAQAAGAVNAALDQVLKDISDREILIGPLRDQISSVSRLTASVAQARQTSTVLQLALGRDPRRLMEDAPRDSALNRVTLSVPQPPPAPSMNPAEAHHLRESRAWARALTGGTEAAESLTSFLENHAIDQERTPQILDLVKTAGVYMNGSSPREKGTAIIQTLRLSAKAVQEYAALLRWPVPSAAKAMDQALKESANPEAKFFRLIRAAVAVNQMAGPEAAERIARYLPEGEPLPFVLGVVAQETRLQSKRGIRLEDVAATLKIAGSLLEWAGPDRLGLFAESPADSKKQFVDWTLKAGKKMIDPGPVQPARGRDPTSGQIADTVQRFVQSDLARSPSSPEVRVSEHKDRLTAFESKVRSAFEAVRSLQKVRAAARRAPAPGASRRGFTTHAFLALGFIGVPTTAMGLPPLIGTAFVVMGLIGTMLAAWDHLRSVPMLNPRVSDSTLLGRSA